MADDRCRLALAQMTTAEGSRWRSWRSLTTAEGSR